MRENEKKMPKKRKVLIITYYWPPAGGPGVQRWLKFVKYLPEFGYNPIILTVDEQYAEYPQQDKSLEQEILDSYNVFKTKSFKLFSFYKQLTNKNETPFSGFASEKKPSLIQKISRFIRGNFFIPDPRRTWNRYAYKKAEELIKTKQINTVITTGPPHSTHLIGLKLKKRLNINWIADLRDPWIDIYYYNKFYPIFFSKKLDSGYEKKVFKQANQIIIVSKSIKKLFAEKYPFSKEKLNILTNGFDEDDFKGINPVKSRLFTITYTGTVSDIYPFYTFIKAIKQLSSYNLKINLVGTIQEQFIKRIEEKGLKQMFNLIGRVSHNTALNYMFGADALLLLIPNTENSDGILTGKLFEYLISNKPIIALGPVDGDLAEIFIDTKSGTICDFNDSDCVTTVIKNLLNQHQNGIINKEINESVYQYTRKNITETLSNIINKFDT